MQRIKPNVGFRGGNVMEVSRTATLLNKDRIIISNPEKYERAEIRNLNYDDGEGLAGYNGNVVVGYGDDATDVFFLSINKIRDEDMDIICEKIQEQFGKDNKLVNLIIYNGESIIYNLNDDELNDEIYPMFTN
jgi:hypothetical protein